MNCHRARQLVFEHLDGLTDERVRLELGNHLAECGECEKLASQLTRSMDLVHRAPVETLDDNFNWKVRLAIHKERHALQESLASQGSLLRAWNIRYAASAVAGFAMVVAAGWMAIGTGVVSLGGGAAVMTQPPVIASGTPSSSDESASKKPVQTSTDPVFTNSPASRMVSFGTPAGSGSVSRVHGALESSATPVDLDSLVQAEMMNRTDQERVDYLQERIRLLQGHLERCKQNINE